jgi:shikimate kinase
MSRRPICVFVGVMGAGKSTVGQLVADALGAPFLDADVTIEARAGKPISEIFVDDGEPHFRALERAVVAEALQTHDGVLALGGGAILAEETRALLRGHTVIYLSVELTDAVKRVGMGNGRPLLAVNPRATLKFLMEQRRPLYDEVATLTVKTDGITATEVAKSVLTALTAPPPPPT